MDLKSPEPFWLVKNGILQSYPSLAQDISTEILVVGSGITGALISHQCMEDGFQTTVIDRRELAHGSTSATTSMLQYELDVPLHRLIKTIGEQSALNSYRACYESIDKIATLSDSLYAGGHFEAKSSLYFAEKPKDLRWLKQEFDCRKLHGFAVEWLNENEISERFQFKTAAGGILSAKAADIDAYVFAQKLQRYNSERGLKIYDKTSIENIEYSTTHGLVRTQYGNSIRAGKIIFCTGFEAVEMIPEKFVRLVSTYAAISEQMEELPDALCKTLSWNTGKPYFYMRSTDDTRICIGGEDIPFVNQTKRDALIGRKVQKLKSYFNQLVPEIDFRVDFSWTGTFGQTNDGLPYIGTHKAFPNAYFVLGFGGNGICFSAIGMEMVSCWLKGEDHLLSPDFRFGRKRG